MQSPVDARSRGLVNPASPLAAYQHAMLLTMTGAASLQPAAALTPARPAAASFPNTRGTSPPVQPYTPMHLQQTPATRARAPPATPASQARFAALPTSAQKPRCASPHAASTAMPDDVTPQRLMPGQQRSRLVEDLRMASKDELLQLLVDLSSFSNDAASFIECKAQALRLQHLSDANPFGSVAQQIDMTDAFTPVKQQMSNIAVTETPNGTVRGAGPQSPYEKMEAEQHQLPDKRSFCEERHPCLLQFGVCRNPQSCVFARAPCNLCAAWVRGDCPSGSRCNYVHRMPTDASQQLQLLHEVKLARQRASGPSFATPTRPDRGHM
jgi:hypothetical protein